jgi:hypothetical protein
MEILLRGLDAPVAKAFLDDLQVSATGEQPRRMGMSEVVHADVDLEPGRLQRG